MNRGDRAIIIAAIILGIVAIVALLVLAVRHEV